MEHVTQKVRKEVKAKVKKEACRREEEEEEVRVYLITLGQDDSRGYCSLRGC